MVARKPNTEHRARPESNAINLHVSHAADLHDIPPSEISDNGIRSTCGGMETVRMWKSKLLTKIPCQICVNSDELERLELVYRVYDIHPDLSTDDHGHPVYDLFTTPSSTASTYLFFSSNSRVYQLCVVQPHQ